ncbi:MAG: ABC transporter ATP-binding protein [Acidimicrobiia bacterium]|nr:ABC transporter ATP-binding protein [Acidimicrobiia bacterium]
MTAAAIEITGLVKRYGDRTAVAGIDVTIGSGEVFGLLGPNGAGKTTTVEILEGYRNADAGTVRVLGLDPIRDAAALRPRIGVMLQEGGLYPGVKPRELLDLFAAFYDEPDDPARLLRLVGLDDAATTMVRRLSGGQAQRLSLALALVGRPEMVFLDEPTAGMDPRARADTWELIRTLRSTGTTVLLTTHYMDEAEQLCDRLAILDHGVIVAAGTPTEVIDTVTEPTLRFTTASPIDPTPLAATINRTIDTIGPEYVVGGVPSPAVIASIAAWLADHGTQLTELRTGQASLEEVFLRLTEEPDATEARSEAGRGRRSAR